MFGADYTRAPLVAGLSLSHSRGLGEYHGVASGQAAPCTMNGKNHCAEADQRKQEALMSGNGGGSGSTSTSTRRDSQSEHPPRGGGSRDGGTAGDPCNVVETTRLNSPDKGVLVTLREGDVLEIKLREEAPRRLLAKRGNNVAGSITSPKHSQIVQCIREGREYEAVVRSVRSGACEVRIQPK